MAILPKARTAAERIESTVDTLRFMKSHLIELSRMAANDKLDMLCYLIEMAVVEADTAILDQKAAVMVSKSPNQATAPKR